MYNLNMWLHWRLKARRPPPKSARQTPKLVQTITRNVPAARCFGGSERQHFFADGASSQDRLSLIPAERLELLNSIRYLPPSTTERRMSHEVIGR